MSEKKIAIRIIHAASDLPFVIGSLLVAVIGPELAPRDPHFQNRIQFIEGELRRAPIEPGDVYPLGTDPFGVDMLTLLLHGVRATITITAVSTLFRILLGLVFMDFPIIRCIYQQADA